MDGVTVDLSERRAWPPVTPGEATGRPVVTPSTDRGGGSETDASGLPGDVPVRLDLLEHALRRASALLAAVPDAGAETQRRWLDEADAVLGIPVDFDRADLLRARERVVRRLPGPQRTTAENSGPRTMGLPVAPAEIAAPSGPGTTRVPPSAPAGQREPGPAAVATALPTALGYVDAAVTALRLGEVPEALELSVRALVAYDTIPARHQDRVIEGRMASALGELCCAFFDHERALRFFEIAVGALSPATERQAWTAASRQVADLCLLHLRELRGADEEIRAELLARAESIGQRLEAIGEPRHVAAVLGRRIVAEVRCEQGAPAAAWPLLEHRERAIDSSVRCEEVGAARREVALLRLARGRCLTMLGRAAEALVELNAALDDLDPDQDLMQSMEGLRLRSLAREAGGDTRGALEDARRLTDRVWARHQRQIGCFMDQVWHRAGAESRRHALEVREQQLILTAEQDPLTGLANRRGVERFCTDQPPGTAVCLVMIDIDHFKGINDRHGHAAGDRVLVEVADVLLGSVREVDRVARWGGEEFLIALPTPSARLGADAAARVLDRVGCHDWAAAVPGLRLTVSAGVATGPAGDLPRVLERADAALYRAKRAGRNRVVTG